MIAGEDELADIFDRMSNSEKLTEYYGWMELVKLPNNDLTAYDTQYLNEL